MRTAVLAVAASIAACGGEKSPAELRQQALTDMKSYLSANLDGLVAAAKELKTAAPAPKPDGWVESRDRAAIETMKAKWRKARAAYERVEGAIAVLFPELDVSTDERYDGFVADNGVDEDLFDANIVTGIHAIERILWSDSIPQRVVEFEQALPNGVYRPARFPKDQGEAARFADQLCARLVADVSKMRDELKPLALDPAAAWRGITGSMSEQREKVELAASGEEESRYAQYTLADMRANLDGGLEVFALFRPWIRAQAGKQQEARLAAAFDRMRAAYGALSGDALPPVPSTWSSQEPTPTDLATPFGKLWAAVVAEADDTAPASLVSEMLDTADKLGIATPRR